MLLVILTITVLLGACSKGSHKQIVKTPKASGTTAKSQSRQPQGLITAPDFTLKKMNGEFFTLSDHLGQVIVLNIWATWCPPCRKEIPDFIKIQKEMRDEGVLFVGVSIDKKGWKVVRPFAKKYEINYPIMVDDGTVARKYGPFRAIPVTFIIGKEGKILYGGAGRIKTESLKRVLEKLTG